MTRARQRKADQIVTLLWHPARYRNTPLLLDPGPASATQAVGPNFLSGEMKLIGLWRAWGIGLGWGAPP
jgi:hypothetical protein